VATRFKLSRVSRRGWVEYALRYALALATTGTVPRPQVPQQNFECTRMIEQP